MHSRKKASSADVRASPGSKEQMISKTAKRNGKQGDAKNHNTGSKWEESVLEKWRGALVKARLALHKKREKKKERRVKCTLARLRTIADAAKKRPQEDEEVPQNPLPPKRKRGRPPLAAKAGKVHVLAVVGSERTSTKILKKARTTSGRSQGDDGDLNEPIPSVTKVKRRRKHKSAITTTTDLDEVDAADLSAEMERKEEIRKKWRNALEIARSALQQKRERRREQARKAAMRRLRRSQDEAVQDDTAQMVFSLKRPSLEELRNFARKSGALGV